MTTEDIASLIKDYELAAINAKTASRSTALIGKKESSATPSACGLVLTDIARPRMRFHALK